jgi:hypothetical protein
MNARYQRPSHSEPPEQPTLIADPRVFHGVDAQEERTPVVTSEVRSKVIEKPRALNKERIAMIALALVALGVFGYRFAGKAYFARVAAADGAEVGQLDPKETAGTTLAEEKPEPDVFTPATPAEAARSFALGEYERALEQYRYLARENPKQDVYTVMVKVLSARKRER